MDTNTTEDTNTERHCHCCKRPEDLTPVENPATQGPYVVREVDVTFYDIRGIDSSKLFSGRVLRRGSLLCAECWVQFLSIGFFDYDENDRLLPRSDNED